MRKHFRIIEDRTEFNAEIISKNEKLKPIAENIKLTNIRLKMKKKNPGTNFIRN